MMFSESNTSVKVQKKSQKSRSLQGITRVVSFTSGKGGVGKSNTVINTALALADLGRSVLILDADLGLANIDILCNLTPKKTIQDLLEGTATLKDIIVEGPMGISIIPSSSGVEYLSRLSHGQRLQILNEVETVAASYDYLLIDTAAGVSPDVMFFNAAANEIICIVTGEPTSLTDGYALIKILTNNYREKEISILANNVPSAVEGQRAFERMQRVVGRFLGTKLRFLGTIPSDQSLPDAVRQQIPVSELFPSSSIARAYRTFARTLDEDFYAHRVKGGVQFFFEQLLAGGQGG